VGQSPKPAPKGTLTAASAPGAPILSGKLAFGVGKWVWINLWAAWCGPCKEEMPRLLGWQEKLRAAGVLIDLAFVSLDDDERQLHRFLETQPANGVRASYWLAEGGGRTAWLGGLNLKETPELPVQALVSPTGEVACVIQGAVEEGDYPAILAFLSAKR
jgi:thiol-disulfide isomerase/thioredoxin